MWEIEKKNEMQFRIIEEIFQRDFTFLLYEKRV